MKEKLAKKELVPKIAEFILQQGLYKSSLREIAKGVDTSDRMLIYYFESKDKIMESASRSIAKQFARHIYDTLPFGEFTVTEGLNHVLLLTRSKEFRPYSRFWIDTLSNAENGSERCKEIGGWIVELLYRKTLMLLPKETVNPREQAAVIVTYLFGMQVLELLGKTEITDLSMKYLQSEIHSPLS